MVKIGHAHFEFRNSKNFVLFPKINVTHANRGAKQAGQPVICHLFAQNVIYMCQKRKKCMKSLNPLKSHLFESLLFYLPFPEEKTASNSIIYLFG